MFLLAAVKKGDGVMNAGPFIVNLLYKSFTKIQWIRLPLMLMPPFVFVDLIRIYSGIYFFGFVVCRVLYSNFVFEHASVRIHKEFLEILSISLF